MKKRATDIAPRTGKSAPARKQKRQAPFFASLLLACLFLFSACNSASLTQSAGNPIVSGKNTPSTGGTSIVGSPTSVVGSPTSVTSATATTSRPAGSTSTPTRSTPTSIPPLSVSLTGFDLPSGFSPYGITTGLDGTIWVSGNGTYQVAQFPANLRSSSQIVPYAFPGLGTLSNITTGSDGTFWLTDETGRIERLFPAGPYTGIGGVALPSGAAPAPITAGPNHTVWFGDIGSSKIGRITGDGLPVEFDLQKVLPFAQPAGITLGPDGAMWFTDAASNNVGRIPANATSSSQITTYATKLVPAGITQADHVLWFTESNVGDSSIGRIDPQTGKVTEYPLPFANQTPLAIVQGPCQQLWFIGRAGNGASQYIAIGALDPRTGKAQEFGLQTQTTGFDVGGLTLANGALWFTAQSGPGGLSKIERVTVAC